MSDKNRNKFLKEDLNFLEILTKWAVVHNIPFSGSETSVINSAALEYAQYRIEQLTKVPIDVVDEILCEYAYEQESADHPCTFKTYGEQMEAQIKAAHFGYSLKSDAWVSVGDRLPELEKNVWDEDLKCYKDTVSALFIVYDKVEDCVFVLNYSEARRFENNTDITHWQPLPSPPKQ